MPDPSPALARAVYELVEPIGLVAFFAEEPNEEQAAIGFADYWDGYFASRAAPLGRVPADVVDALFYSFAPGEVARHVPRVWEVATPEAAYAAKERGCVAGLRTALGGLGGPGGHGGPGGGPGLDGVGRAADLLLTAARSAPVHGRALFAAYRALPVPEGPLARLWHGANLLREHRGDGHSAALLVCGIGATEAHVLWALGEGMEAHQFGRLHHLPAAQLAGVVEGMRVRGLVDDDGRLTDVGRARREQVERLTDELAVAPYEALTSGELTELIGLLEPLAAVLRAAWAHVMP